MELARLAVIRGFAFFDIMWFLMYYLLRQILCICIPPISTISFI